MDRTSSSAQNTTPFTYESLPNEIQRLILSKIPEVDEPPAIPTLHSVSYVSRRLHALAMPFLMECHVSMMERAVPGFSSEKKVNTLLQLNNWLFEHADQMPSNAYFDALKRTKKLTDGLSIAELELFLREIQPSFTARSDAPFSVNKIIAMQMMMASHSSASGQLTAHYRNISSELKKCMNHF